MRIPQSDGAGSVLDTDTHENNTKCEGSLILADMLTRVYVDNFRSFVNFEFRPEQKQLLLGANGSGKSSLLEVIRFVKYFVDDNVNHFTQSTRTRWQDQAFQVIEIDASLMGKAYTYRIEIRFAPESKQHSVHLESLRVDGVPVFELTNGEIHFYFDDGREATPVPFEVTQSALRMALYSNSHVRRFVEWLRTVHCFKIDPYPEKMDERADSEDMHPDFELENIAPWYRHLVQAYPEDNALFLQALKASLNGFQALRFSSEEDGVRRLWADFSTPGKKKVSYSLSELSDGQRCLIGLYMILHFAIMKGHTVFIDEPDNYVALREIQPWLLDAAQEAEDHHGQFIVISHHPEMLNQWASAYGLNFFREKNGQVQTERFKGDPDGVLESAEMVARGWELV
jgi:predicted ATPase